ncbi:MAG: hypothetical protein ABI857_10210 [Acidobacteriota bacterium]
MDNIKQMARYAIKQGVLGAQAYAALCATCGDLVRLSIAFNFEKL